MSLDPRDCQHGIGLVYNKQQLVLLHKGDEDLVEIRFNFCPFCGVELEPIEEHFDGLPKELDETPEGDNRADSPED